MRIRLGCRTVPDTPHTKLPSAEQRSTFLTDAGDDPASTTRSSAMRSAPTSVRLMVTLPFSDPWPR